ncbi:YciI family protein [Microbulbifer sp. ZKSA006]|uniref:YciI family protein n=1 Tax=Microbulbifer sp. ZKSA006 TaxID=3243390 RepID=UPI004039EA2D
MYIVSLTYTAHLDKIEKHLNEHILYLDNQYKLGNFIISGRKVPRTGGVIIATVTSRSELDKILSLDPFYRENLAEYDITQIVPTKTSAELEHLLDT